MLDSGEKAGSFLRFAQPPFRARLSPCLGGKRPAATADSHALEPAVCEYSPMGSPCELSERCVSLVLGLQQDIDIEVATLALDARGDPGVV
jgi:hypothetical protein